MTPEEKREMIRMMLMQGDGNQTHRYAMGQGELSKPQFAGAAMNEPAQDYGGIMGGGSAPMTSPRPQPAPSLLRRRSMMDRAQEAQEDAYARQIDPEQWALYQIEDEGVAFKEMLRDLPPELYREVLRKVAEGVPVPEAFAPAGFTTRR